jgi:hypothetical protein
MHGCKNNPVGYCSFNRSYQEFQLVWTSLWHGRPTLWHIQTNIFVFCLLVECTQQVVSHSCLKSSINACIIGFVDTKAALEKIAYFSTPFEVEQYKTSNHMGSYLLTAMNPTPSLLSSGMLYIALSLLLFPAFSLPVSFNF